MDSVLGGFERAVAGTLDELEVGLLGRPQEFVGAVADLYDPDSAEVAVLYLHCTSELLRPFAEAARTGTTDAFEQAARRAELWLHDVRRVDVGDAHSVAWGIARGTAAHLGVALPREPNAGGQTGWDDATSAVVERVRAVLADSGSTEADIASVLDAVCALPAGTQGKAALKSALGRRLEKLAGEREAEEHARAEAARKRRAERDQLLAEREARRRAAAQGGSASGPDPKPDPQPNNRVVVAAITVIACVVVAIALFANSNSITQTKASGSNAVAAEDDVPSIPVREDVSEYSWGELKGISNVIANAKSDKEGLKIAKEYNLVDSKGKLQGDTKTVKLTDGTKTSVRILGFRHDKLAGGGKAGITFEFADSPKTHCMNSEDTNEGGWEASDMRAWLNSKFLALLPDDLQSCIVAATKRTNNVGGDAEYDASLVTVTFDKLWLLSYVEVEGAVSKPVSKREAWNAEGAQYKLYADDGDGGQLDEKSGAAQWWTRSSWWNTSETGNGFDEYPDDLSRARFSSLTGYAGGSGAKAAKRLSSTRLACYMTLEIDWIRAYQLPTVKNGVSPGFCF